MVVQTSLRNYRASDMHEVGITVPLRVNESCRNCKINSPVLPALQNREVRNGK